MKLYRDVVPALRPRESAGKLIPPHALFAHGNDEVELLCRERVAPTYIGDGQMLSRVLGRFKMLTDTSDVGFAPHIIMDGYWEMWMTRWMVETVQRSWTALDVGANFGYYSILLAELVGEEGRLLAFEPNPACARATKFSLEINSFAPRSEVHEVALSNAAGSCSFFVPTNEPKNGHLVFGETHEAGIEYSDDGTRFTVPIDTLDNVAEPLDKVDFIKIDAEGAELTIFEGMQKTIERHNPLVIMEYNAIRGDTDGFVEQLKAAYPKARYLDEREGVRDLQHERLKHERVGQDWLLILKK
ncbi:FkbM family methyltransferase [Altererythrobacter sp. GH1-8]|uniref:FkbM family methyltransferase n=1 Tax=Altererythrobacter sp. GH1-8 TaxID=3349333 RepID=UPI00374DA0A5